MVFSKTDLPSSSGTEALSPSPSVPSATRVVSGGSSDVPTPPPDPRWPYLNRWSGSKVSLAETIGQVKSSAAKSPTVRQATDPIEAPAAVASPVYMISLEKEEIALKSNPPTGNVAPAVIASPVAPSPSQGPASKSPPTIPATDSLEAPAAVHDSPVAPAAAHESSPIAPAKATLPSGTVAPPPRQAPLAHGSGHIPALGAWNKKLNFTTAPPFTHGGSSVDKRVCPRLGTSKLPNRGPEVFVKPTTMEDDIRFPWAAKMDPSKRNLYRATEPEFLEDGTPKVTIPQHVFVQGLENQKEYVLGQFYRCSPPPGGLIFAIVNNLWGRNCKVNIRKLGDSSYLFHIPDESTRTWVLQRGLWHVDDCLMFVAPWTPEPSLAIPEIKTIPVWVTLKKIPSVLYSISGISHIASGLGAPMATHKPRLDPIFTGEAKILVEVELNKAFPPKIAAEDKTGFICMVDVEYAWLPSKCTRCGQLGHRVKRCLQSGIDSTAVVTTTNSAPMADDNVCIEVPTSTPTIDSASASAQFDSVSAHVTEVPTCDSVKIAPTSAIVSTTQAITHPIIEGSPSSPVTTDPLPATTVTVPNLIIPISASEKVTMCTPQASSPAATTNEKVIESPISGTARPLSATKDTIAQEHSSSHLGRESSIEPDFGSNKFASLVSLEEDADSSESDKELDETDHMTPSAKRILRDRPVKPTAKAKEMHWQPTARGRGNRGRGSRG